MALAKAFSGSKKRWKADSGGLRVDESKETEVQVLIGTSVLLNPHAHSVPHIYSWKISYLPNASRQLLPCLKVQTCCQLPQ